MRLPSHLVKNRFGIYYYCIVFPLKISVIINKKQARRSLKTSERNIATMMALEFARAVDWLFKRIAAGIMNWKETKDFLDQVADKLFQKYVQRVNEVGFNFYDPDTLETVCPPATVLLHDPTGCAIHSTNFTNDPSESVHTTQGEFQRTFFTKKEVVSYVDSILSEAGKEIKKGTDEYRSFCRQMLEMLYLLDQRKAEYYQQMMHGIPVTAHAQATPIETVASEIVPSITLRELIEKYIKEKTIIAKKWKNPRTTKGYKENLERIHEIFQVVTDTKDVPIGMLTREHARQVREVLAIIPANLKKKFPNTPLEKIIADCKKGLIATNEKDRLSPNTFNTYANLIGGMFRYAKDEEYVTENYFTKLRVDKKIEKTREAFTDEELTHFFNTDLFVKKDFPLKWSWRFFIPVMMLYTGARLNEIAQLDLTDIAENNGILCFQIREKVDVATGKKITTTKNVQSNRIIPVHPALRKVGLLEYVDHLRKIGKKQLFPTLSSTDSKGKHKQRHSNVSKYFNENDPKQHKVSYISRCGITDPKKVLYCFRHTMETALINHPDRIEHDIIDSIMGHQVKSTGRKHYGSYSAETLLRELSKIEFAGAKLPWNEKGYSKIPFSWEK